MIGRLKGIIVVKQPPELIIDVNGLGYELQASMNTFYHLPDMGKEIILYTHLVVREDAQSLYGFYDLQERKLFRELIKVSGVGPKMAIAILSNVDPNGFVQCVLNHNIANLIHIPGVGKKTAERLIVEMQDRVKNWNYGDSPDKAFDASDVLLSPDDATQDAISALIALGYKPQEASRAISKVSKANLSSEELIRLALQNMSK